MKKRKILLSVVGTFLFMVSCVSKNAESLPCSDDTNIDSTLQARADSICQSFVSNHSASLLRIMVMDSNGCIVANSRCPSNEETLSNADAAYEPGALMFPIIVASIDGINMSMMLPVGTKNFGGFCLSDSHRILDTATGYYLDSITVQQAIEHHSNVAMAELSRLYYYDNREALLSNIGSIMPNTDFPNLSNDKSFYQFCIGHGFKVPMRTLLGCYCHSEIANLVPHGCMNASYINNQERMQLCIGYSSDGKYMAMVVAENIGTNGQLASSVIDSLFR